MKTRIAVVLDLGGRNSAELTFGSVDELRAEYPNARIVANRHVTFDDYMPSNDPVEYNRYIDSVDRSRERA